MEGRSRLGSRRAPSWSVDRTSLVDRLESMAAVEGVTLICAAPGSGKSELVRQWCERERVPPTVVQFRAADVGPAQCVQRILQSLPGAPPTQLGAPDLGDEGERSLIARHIDEHLERDVAIVFEDVHHLARGPVSTQLGQIVDELADTRRIIVVSRSDPSWPLSIWRVSGRLFELRQRDVDLRDDEAAAILDRIVPDVLDDQDRKRLISRCDGWAAGVVLAAVALRGRSDPRAFVDVFSGGERVVADYLFEEAYSQFTDEERHLMLSTSVCGVFDGELAVALTGSSRASELLRDLSARVMLISPVDGLPGWFRYHDLFAEMLRHELNVTRPGAADDLRRCAAEWHGRAAARTDGGSVSHLSKQVGYLTQLADWKGVAAAVQANGRSRFRNGQNLELLACLQAIPTEQLDTDTALSLATVYLSSGRQWQVDEMLRVAADAGLDDLQSIRALLTVASGVEFERPPTEVIAATDDVVSLLDRTDPSTTLESVVIHRHPDAMRQGALMCRGRAFDLLGDDAAAVENLEAAHSEYHSFDTFWTLHALSSHALVEARRGNSSSARSLADRAIGGATQIGMSTQPIIGNAHLALGIIAIDSDQARALHHFDRCRAACTPNRRWATLVEERIWSAEAHRLLGDDPAAAIRTLHDDAHNGYLAPRLRADVMALSARCLLDIGDHIGAEAALLEAPIATMAVHAARASLLTARDRLKIEQLRARAGLTARELEVLAAMTGRATNTEIAQRLHISLHTLKTHQRHVYEKLDVPNRNSAVDRAEQLGIL